MSLYSSNYKFKRNLKLFEVIANFKKKIVAIEIFTYFM